VKQDETTLSKWNRENYCPIIGRAIETRPLPGVCNREEDYFRKADLDDINRAKARNPEIPEYAGLIFLDTAAAELRITPGNYRNHMRLRKERAVPKPGRRPSGIPFPRAYVRLEFHNKLKSLLESEDICPGEMKSEAVEVVLGLTKNGVDSLVTRGVLKPRIGLVKCAGRKGGGPGFLRSGRIFSRAEVEAYKSKRNGTPPPTPINAATLATAESLNGKPTGNGAPNVNEAQKPLSALANDFLDTLFDWKAFSPAQRASVAEVAKKLGAISTTLGRIACDLKRRGLVDSTQGQGGGYWLTRKGKLTVEANRQ
jgi:hypothetical protein